MSLRILLQGLSRTFSGHWRISCVPGPRPVFNRFLWYPYVPASRPPIVAENSAVSTSLSQLIFQQQLSIRDHRAIGLVKLLVGNVLRGRGLASGGDGIVRPQSWWIWAAQADVKFWVHSNDCVTPSSDVERWWRLLLAWDQTPASPLVRAFTELERLCLGLAGHRDFGDRSFRRNGNFNSWDVDFDGVDAVVSLSSTYSSEGEWKMGLKGWLQSEELTRERLAKECRFLKFRCDCG